jgi:hypothetical protein
MTMLDRNTVIEELITGLKGAAAGTYPYLAAVTDAAIQYCIRDPTNLKLIKYNKEIWLGPIDDDVPYATVGKYSHRFTIGLLVVYVGEHQGITEFKTVVDIAQDVEKYIFSNPTLSSSGAVLREGIKMDFSYAFSGRGTVHFAYIEIPYDHLSSI